MNPFAYRPISISSYVGKLLEKILERRIKLHCERNVIIVKYEYNCFILQSITIRLSKFKTCMGKLYMTYKVIDQMADGTLVSLLCHHCVTLASP